MRVQNEENVFHGMLKFKVPGENGFLEAPAMQKKIINDSSRYLKNAFEKHLWGYIYFEKIKSLLNFQIILFEKRNLKL